MEQRIGSSSQPLEGAGFDPAYIPGLTSPGSAETESVPEETEVTSEEVVEEAGEEHAEGPVEELPEGPVEESAEGPVEEEAPEGPVFEASDRRAKIVADHRGVRLSLDDQACEFRWDEIGAVETESPRFGKRFTITVHTPDRRWYPIEIEATSRSRFAEWDEQIDAVLDAYFEDGTSETAEEESDQTP
ncbi:hypothetical protein ACFYZ8_13075 [Streptomyces sp. NPDC001668]|uniref:hypothetical protein n=1 Tax=unclassified Streptomyces TaxID=2593676 RepID=UPI0033EA80D8